VRCPFLSTCRCTSSSRWASPSPGRSQNMKYDCRRRPGSGTRKSRNTTNPVIHAPCTKPTHKPCHMRPRCLGFRCVPSAHHWRIASAGMLGYPLVPQRRQCASIYTDKASSMPYPIGVLPSLLCLASPMPLPHPCHRRRTTPSSPFLLHCDRSHLLLQVWPTWPHGGHDRAAFDHVLLGAALCIPRLGPVARASQRCCRWTTGHHSCPPPGCSRYYVRADITACPLVSPQALVAFSVPICFASIT